MFRWQKKAQKIDSTASIHLYRRCLRIIKQLIPSHQKLWYDYTRLKYQENASVTDPIKIKKLIEQGKEELSWMETVIQRTKE
jgi:hypothetical protein